MALHICLTGIPSTRCKKINLVKGFTHLSFPEEFSLTIQFSLHNNTYKRSSEISYFQNLLPQAVNVAKNIADETFCV